MDCYCCLCSLVPTGPRCPGHSRPVISCRPFAATAPATLPDLEKLRVIDATHQTVHHTLVSRPVEVKVGCLLQSCLSPAVLLLEIGSITYIGVIIARPI